MVETRQIIVPDTAFYAVLPGRALISVRGPDWRDYLQGLLTQDVDTLKAGEIRFAALLSAQGKLLFDLFVIGVDDDGCLLDVQAAQRDALIPRLNLYRLRAKVTIEAVEGRVVVLAGPALSQAAGWVADPRLPELGFRGVDLAAPPGVRLGGEDDYEAWRLSLGVPDPARDCIPDKTYPIEANFDLLNGIDFHKGCFVGQETSSRMKRRGQIKNRMLPITFDGPPPPFGAEVLAGDLRAGEVLSGRKGMAMALVRLDRIEGAALTVDGRGVSVREPDWLS